MYKINLIEKFLISDLQLTERMSKRQKLSKCQTLAKRQKLSFFHFECLPNELILKIFSFLDIKGVLRCGHVSKRLRAISNNQSLWLKLNLFRRKVPYGFIETAVQNGCGYLNLGFSGVHGGKKSEVPWKLKYLEMSQSCQWALEVPKGVLENCRSLQKLSVDNLRLNSFDIEQICQNGETLQTLSLEGCNVDFHLRTGLIQKLFTKCSQLSELNISKGVGGFYGDKIILDPHVCALVDNLTPDILKLNLGAQLCVQDKHVETLVRRCNKIKELDLSFALITNDAMECIIKNLNYLEKLDVHYTIIDFSTLLQLKSVPTLKMLRCFDSRKTEKENNEMIKNLKLQLPHISINEEEDLNIACPRKEVNGFIDRDWFWEIRAKPQDLFPKLERIRKRFKCPHCELSFVFKHNLKIHSEQYHTELHDIALNEKENSQ